MVRALVIFGLLGMTSNALAFEHTKVLPKGVRNATLRMIDTEISEKTNANGIPEPLSQPLAKDLTFARILQGETGVKRQQLEAFLLANGFPLDQSIGTFSADLQGRVSVVAPVFSYGLTEKLTLALAIPYYRASTAVEMGFKPNPNAQTFLTTLTQPSNNQTQSAREAAEKFNSAVEELNKKLARNGYSRLDTWEGQGLGDIVVAAKHQTFASEYFIAALTGGVNAPTGRGDDPDLLTDLPFGDQQWDVFAQAAFDQPLVAGIGLNEYAKYTYQAPGRKSIRAKTEDEAIEVELKRVSFKLGDKVDAGVSLVYEPAFGLTTGIGRSLFRKRGDQYRGLSLESETEWEKGSDQSADYNEYKLGYSTVPAYQQGTFKVPFSVGLEFKQHVKSRNMPVSDLAQAELSLFF